MSFNGFIFYAVDRLSVEAQSAERGEVLCFCYVLCYLHIFVASQMAI